MTAHLRLDDSRPSDAAECICGNPACTRWYEDALHALSDEPQPEFVRASVVQLGGKRKPPRPDEPRCAECGRLDSEAPIVAWIDRGRLCEDCYERSA